MKNAFRMTAVALAAALMIPLAANAAAIGADEPQLAPQYTEVTGEHLTEAAPMTSLETTPQPMSGEELPSISEERDETGLSEETVSGIPITHLVLFCGGLVVCIAVLLGLRLARRGKDQ